MKFDKISFKLVAGEPGVEIEYRDCNFFFKLIIKK